MITVIVIALALCAVVLFYMAVRSRRKQAVQSLRPVDLTAFHTLLDRDDELFIKRKAAALKVCPHQAPSYSRDRALCGQDCLQRFHGLA